MSPAPQGWRRLVCLALVGTALSACGGGGGSDGPQAAGKNFANATGFWQGSFASSDGTTRGFRMLIAPDGRFAGSVDSTGLNGRIVLGTGMTIQSVFSASGTVFAQAGEGLLPNGQSSDALTVSSSAVVAGVSLTGNLSGGGESASFTLSYEGTRGGSLQSIAGIYAGYPLQAGRIASSSLTVNGNALTWANDNGCNAAGNIEVIDPALNIYSWSMLLSACGGVADHTISGLGTLATDPLGANLLLLYGATATNELPFTFRGFR
jgi:hypothetical protein